MDKEFGVFIRGIRKPVATFNGYGHADRWSRRRYPKSMIIIKEVRVTVEIVGE